MIKILIIDDSPDVGKTLKLYFEKNGCQVINTLSGEEGLAMTRIHRFNVILLDVHMPEMGGRTVLAALKKVFPKIPIIMITGFDDHDVALECMNAGAYDFVTKPIDFDYLKTSVFSTGY